MSQPPILLVDHAPFLGGAEVALLNVAVALRELGWEAAVAAPPTSPLATAALARALPIVPLDIPPLRGGSPRRWARAARTMAATLRGGPWRIVQTNTTRAHLVGALACAMTGTPLVWLVHDDTLPRWSLPTLGLRPARIVFVSHWLSRRYRRLSLNQGRLRVIHNGVRVSRAKRRRKGGDGVLAASVGRLVRWKGHHHFLEALARAGERHPQLRGRIVGGTHPSDEGAGELAGGQPYLEELKAQAARLGLSGRVDFSGFVPEMASLWEEVDLAVFAPIRPEPFGLALVEAMASGVPVIAPDEGGPREIVEHGVSGLLYPPRQVAGLAAALSELAADAARRELMGEAAQDRARRHFTLEAQAAAYDRLYRELT